MTERQGIRQLTRYGYDAFGRRSWKQDGFGLTHFIWDGNRLLSEERGVRSLTWVYDDAGFVPLAQIAATAGETEEQAEIYWYHTDQVGLPRELSDSGGEIVWRAEYQAWGNTQRVVYRSSQEEAIYQPLRFQGQYYDAETGLHYNRFRYYDPDAGRFISQDPIGLVGGLNTYAYVKNPLTWIDPLGLAGNNILFDSDFWKAVGDSSVKTKIRVKGATVFEIIKKVDLDGIKKGDLFHLDTLHLNEIEVYDSKGSHKAVYGLDGKKSGDAVKGRKCG